MGRKFLIAAMAVILGLSMMGSTAWTAPRTGVPPLRPRHWLWVGLYNGPANDCDDAHALGVSPDGDRVYVTGHSSDGSRDDYATVAYDAATGAEVWTARYNGPGNHDDSALALGVSPDGSRVYVTGRSYGVSSSTDYATVAYDAATGSKVWTARYDGRRTATTTHTPWG